MNMIVDAKTKVVPVMQYSRVSGYYANYQSLNLGKKSERDERVYYKVPELKNE